MKRILKVIVFSSERRDGTVAYTATLERLPGIVIEADSQEEAISLLQESLFRLERSVGIPDHAFEDATVEEWYWRSYSEGRRRLGPDQTAFSLSPAKVHA